MLGNSSTPLVAVTGSQRPYIFDLPQVLSLPDGFEFRFRYYHTWVAEDIKRRLQATRDRTDATPREKMRAGEPLLIVFHSQELKRLLPIRRCTVIGLELLGPMVFLRFRLGPLIRVAEAGIAGPTSKDLRDAESWRLNAVGLQLLDLTGHDLSQSLPNGSYLRQAAAGLDETLWAHASHRTMEGEAATWAAVAALLQNEPQLFRVPLFRLMGFQKQDGTYQGPEDIKRSFTVSPENTRGFKLTEGKRYRLRLLEWCETVKGEGPGVSVTATLPSTTLSLEGASNLVVGKYDVVEFSCMALKPGYGELAIHVEPPPVAAKVAAVSGRTEEGIKEPSSMRAVQEGRQAQSSTGSVGASDADQGAADTGRRSPSGGHEGPTDHLTAAPWPYIYAARVPIHVTHSWLRLGGLLLLAGVGIVLYIWAPEVPIFIRGAKLPHEAGQLVGLLMVFTALGEYLQRFVKFSTDVKELPLVSRFWLGK